jgi:hypothetical protein
MVGQQTPRTVEQWALQVLDSYMRGGRLEDARIEFKRQLPEDAQRIARRLAGHANASRGDPILWIVGVDENERKIVPGQLPRDPASFWSQVWSKFDGPHPELIDLQVDLDGVPVLALGFNCERVPYVIYTGTDSPRLEVPWREGTRVDTASRSQLIRLVQPVARAPVVEVRNIGADAAAIAVTFFVVPPGTDPLMLPVHRAILECGDALIPAFEVIGNKSKLTQPHPVLKEAAGQGVYFYGLAEVVAKWRVPMNQPRQTCRARLTFEPGGVDVVVVEGIPPR